MKLLSLFTERPVISQVMMSGASGCRPGSFELGGKMTALARAKLIEKCGRDENGQLLWQLNKKKTALKELESFMKSMGISTNSSIDEIISHDDLPKTNK